LIKDYSLYTYKIHAILGPKVELYYDFANLQTEDWVKNLRKQLAIGSFLWQGVHWTIQHSDIDGKELPEDPVYLAPSLNWRASGLR